jgi:hypothetical protein
MKDIHSDMTIVAAIGAAVLSADNTPAAIDLQGYNAAEIVLNIGIGGITFSASNKIEFKLTHSDDDSTYTDVTVDDMLGLASVGSGGIIKSLVAAHAAAAVYRYGYKGSKRYLKLLADFSGTHGTGTPIAANVIKMHGFNKPEANRLNTWSRHKSAGRSRPAFSSFTRSPCTAPSSSRRLLPATPSSRLWKLRRICALTAAARIR